jgi:hypothetical protein
MPGLSGFDVATVLRQELPRTKILLMSVVYRRVRGTPSFCQIARVNIQYLLYLGRNEHVQVATQSTKQYATS